MESRNILIYLSLKFNGDWEKIYEAIKSKEKYDENEVNKSIEAINSEAITILDEEYPQTLKNCCKPPFVLFYHGDISLLDCKFNSVGVVGSRKCSKYGEECGNELVKNLSNDLVIISGMAIGIDSIAHNAALESKKKTIAVLGSGINYIYPTSNASLYKRIIKEGLVISEYPDKTPPTQKTFPIRNRIIAFLTNCILIPEAKLKSGTSITASLELSQGGNVCVCPDRRGRNSLCNYLIQNGACLVETVEDIYEEMNYKKHQPVFE